MITVLASVLVFGLLIGIHEFGHLISAKLIGIKVYEFAIGMGVKLFSFEKRDGTIVAAKGNDNEIWRNYAIGLDIMEFIRFVENNFTLFQDVRCLSGSNIYFPFIDIYELPKVM